MPDTFEAEDYPAREAARTLLESTAAVGMAPARIRPPPASDLSRTRFFIAQCSGICTLLIMCLITVVLFLSKNEGVDEAVTSIARAWQQALLNKTSWLRENASF